MRLIGKIPTKDRGIVDEVYLAEQVRCSNCQKTVPLGIEVVRVQKEEKGKKILKHAWYCRAHGADYVSRAEGYVIDRALIFFREQNLLPRQQSGSFLVLCA